MKETKELLKKLDPVFQKTQGLWYLNLFSKDREQEWENQALLRLLADKSAKINYQDEIRLPPPGKEKLTGRYEMGKVIYPDEEYSSFGLRKQDFPRHILLAGITGAGKTNLVFNLLRQVNKHDKKFLLFDWKRSYRKLQGRREFKNLRIIRLGEPDCDFKFNPLIPPKGINPKHWLAFLTDIIKHSFFGSYGVEYFMRKGIDRLYQQFGIYDGKTEYPTFVDLEKLLRKEYTRGREQLWMASVKRSLAALTFEGLMGDVLNVREHKGIDSLLDEDVVIEMDNFSNLERTFFIEALLLWIYHYKKVEGKRDGFTNVVVIEEAHFVCNRKKEDQSGEETIIETIIRMVREFGVGIIVVDQQPSKLSDSILANCNTKICFDLSHFKDIVVMAGSMNLSLEERDYLDKLKVGHAMVKVIGRIDKPVLVKIPLITFNPKPE